MWVLSHAGLEGVNLLMYFKDAQGILYLLYLLPSYFYIAAAAQGEPELDSFFSLFASFGVISHLVACIHLIMPQAYPKTYEKQLGVLIFFLAHLFVS